MNVSAPFCDYLSVSVPSQLGPDLRRDLVDVCLQVPGAETDPLGARVGRFGLLRFADHHGVSIVSASGVVLAALRGAHLLEEFCARIAERVTYRVTRLDAAVDVECDPPAFVGQLRSFVRAHGCRLSRKRVGQGAITFLENLAPDGRVTGTLYVGRRTARVFARVYDRQQNARAKGMDDPGSLARVEITCADAGLSLRDVVDPEALFYRYASPDLLPDLSDGTAWVPGGDGFVVPRREWSAAERLGRLVDVSGDLGQMFRLLGGELRLPDLVRLIERRYAQYLHGIDLGLTSGPSLPAPASGGGLPLARPQALPPP